MKFFLILLKLKELSILIHGYLHQCLPSWKLLAHRSIKTWQHNCSSRQTQVVRSILGTSQYKNWVEVKLEVFRVFNNCKGSGGKYFFGFKTCFLWIYRFLSELRRKRMCEFFTFGYRVELLLNSTSSFMRA